MPFGPTVRSITQPGGLSPTVKQPVYPTWTRSYNTRGHGTWPGHEENSPSRYEQFVAAMMNDERFQREVTLGKRIGLYKFRGELGTGNFSRVKLAFHQLAHERVAVKIMEKTGMDQKALKMLSREITNMDTVRHPAIVRLFEVMETISKVYLVMEVAPCGEMYTRLTNDGKYDEPAAKHLYNQLISAVEFMHGHDLYHRDIKAENIFLSSPDTVRLGDFGFSTQVLGQSDQPTMDRMMLTTFCGSPPYAAPELFHDDAYFGAAVDVWALGVLLFFMVTATMPFQAQTVAGLKQSILENCFTVPSYVSDPCANLIRAILRRSPTERITLTGIRNCDWLRDQVPLQPLPTHQFVPSPPEAEKTPMETKVLNRLEELGITEEMLWQNRDKGGRSAIVGTYRILMYRSCIEEEAEKAVAELKKQKETHSNGDITSEAVRSNSPEALIVHNQKLNKETLSSSSPTTSPVRDTKFRHKLNLTFGRNKTKKKSTKKGSRTCVIL